MVHNEGLKSDPTDDKANYIYGEKELWYVDSIVSKNYIAVFEKENREDGFGVDDENGKVATSNPMQLLRKISLFTLREFRKNPNAVPIKEVHFDYDYSLCPGVPNNNSGTGKLTLKKVFFTYQNSKKAQLSPYEFEYNGNNPAYNIKSYDRWGNFKQNNGQTGPLQAFNAAEFPYVEQIASTPALAQANADANLSAWNLTDILLPSGGKIKVNYEADDYAFVQNKPAMQMFKIIDAKSTPTLSTVLTNPHPVQLDDLVNKNYYLFFELQPGFTSSTDIGKYFEGVDKLYFRCLAHFDPINQNMYDYVSGYANIQSYGWDNTSGTPVGWVKLVPKDLGKIAAAQDFNPITLAALQFGRLNMSRFMWSQPGVGANPTLGKSFLNALVNSDFLKNIKDAVEGPNFALWDPTSTSGNKCHEIVVNKSFFRLNCVTKKKFGGGCRVKKIEMSDEWNNMGTQMKTFQYGQEYKYTLPDGTTSSGVASYEPQLGGDENPWRMPVAFSDEKLLVPDDEHYMETPFGESFFPSASVGYSRVVVQNLQYTNVNRHATGKVVHEFYTAKDFPTIPNMTGMDHKQEKTDKFSISSLFKVKAKDYMTATQGFSVELNDMHGKPKTQSVYQEDNTTAISSVEYKYKATPYGVGSFRLDNSATVIDPQGNVKPATIGVFFDMAVDMRQERTELNSFTLMINVDIFMITPIPVPVPIPMVWPSSTEQITQFRSATTTKIIQRFGLLEETIAKDLGSTVSTNNLAYDSETGEILLTQTTTDFNDQVFTLNYPAHWYYDGMGQSYRNLGFTTTSSVSFSAGQASIQNASKYFVPGDELKVGNTKVWVVEVSGNSIKVLLKNGQAFSGSGTVKVIRSGRKNMAGTTMESATLLSNPLTNFKNNLFDNVLQASAIEFTDRWRTFCDCFNPPSPPIIASTNPYVVGTRGNWRKKKSLLHLAGRSQSNYDNNTNIRIDGVFTSFRPYYRLNSNQWQIDEKDWTFTSEVTEFSPFGQELENVDALGRFSAATFGYRQTLPTSVAANAKYRDIGFDHFEDYGFSPCADNHFKFPNISDTTSTQSHTGRYSIKVSNGSSATMIKTLEVCNPHTCILNITKTIISTSTSEINVSNGIAPFQIDWNVIQGNPIVNSNGNNLTITGTGWTVEIIVLDASGCKTTKIFTQP
ncbi:MAG: hypothetical protein HY841_04065 [Bacteroidetes bacterium]|nr:hypothetical protein [Bacteroidota bacterium]